MPRFPDLVRDWPFPSCGVLLGALLCLIAIQGPSVRATFTDWTEQSGLILEPGGDYSDPKNNAASFAVVDINGDGLLDLYATRSFGGNHLFVNEGDGTFVERAAEYGLTGPAGSNGAVFADFDNDGDPDLFIAPEDSPRFYFYINQGDGSFVEEAESRGGAILVEELWHNGHSVAVGDYDLDGWLDIYVCDYYSLAQVVDPATHSVLLRNRGEEAPGHFENATSLAGVEIVDSEGRQHSYSAAFADFNQDAWPDLVVIGDYGTSRFFFNNGNGTFRDATISVGANKEENGMGIAVGDYDGDLYLDYYATSIFDNPGLPQPQGLTGNRMYRYFAEETRFQETSFGLGIRDAGFSWGTVFVDADNDEDLDLLATNAVIFQDSRLPEQTKFWKNDGSGGYELASDTNGILDEGQGYGVLNWDFDNDGDQDLLIGQLGDHPILYRNDSQDNDGHWLRLSFEGVSSNRDGIGVKVLVEPGFGRKDQYFEYNPSNLFMAQSEPILHIGLGSAEEPVSKITLTWPSGIVQELENVEVDQLLHLVEPDPEGPAPPVAKAQPSGLVLELGGKATLSFEATGNPAPVYQWEKDGTPIPGANQSTLVIDRIQPFDIGNYRAKAINPWGEVVSSEALIDISIEVGDHSVARWWNEFLLEAIRKDFPAPTIHARNLFHVSAAMWDAYWAYDIEGWERTAPAFHKEEVVEADWGSDREAAQREAISYAAFRVLMERYKNSEGRERSEFGFRWLMEQFGYDPDYVGVDGQSPASVGNRIGLGILQATLDDGSNEANGYMDPSGYTAANDPLVVGLSGAEMNDPNRWQPLAFEFRITQNGIPVGESIQSFIGSNWRDVETFAIEKSGSQTIAIDPGPPPFLGDQTETEFIEAAVEVIRYSSLLDPDAGELIDISPGARLNNRLGSNDGIGRILNPATGEPYAENIVNHADYGRILAEFWADGPSSETPPGHWNALHNEIADNPQFQHRYGGWGHPLPRLEWDIQAYLALNGAMHDAAIAAWTLKRQYDYVRPISIIRYLGGLGQSTDPEGDSYDPQGLPLEPGLIEVVTEQSSAPGERHERLSDYVGDVAIRAWVGEADELDPDSGGVDWIRAIDWMPYQRSTFVTPAFAAYVSGHSAFSRAGAEVLTLLSGSPFFPGGLGEFHFEANEFLEFESGPSESVALQWATYYDAADQAGVSRLYGGIHVSADDIAGRILGARVGLAAFLKADGMRNGKSGRGGFVDAWIQGPRKTGESILTNFQLANASSDSLPVIALSRLEDVPYPPVGVFIGSEEREDIITTGIVGAEIVSLKHTSWVGNPENSSPVSVTFEVTGEDAKLILISSSISGLMGETELSEAIQTMEIHRLHQDGMEELVVTNRNWAEGDTSSLTEVASLASGKGPILDDDAAAALVLRLGPGQYRAVVSADDLAGAKISLGIDLLE